MRNPFSRKQRIRECKLCYAVFHSDESFYEHINREHFTSIREGTHRG